MKHTVKKILPYLIFFAALFYGAPLVLTFQAMPVFLLLVNPLCLIGAGIFYAAKHGFQWYFLIAVPLVFVPTLFTVYNDTAWVYVPAYLVFLAIGQGIGCIFRRGRKAE